MKTYTISAGRLTTGIQCSETATVAVGESGRGRKLVAAPLPAGCTIDWSHFTAAHTDEYGAVAASGYGLVTDVPGEAGSVVVLIRDHSGYRGGWDLTAPREAAEYQLPNSERPPRRPHGVKVIAQGECAQGDAGRMGGGPEYLLVLADGQAVEVVRSGRLYGSASVIRLDCRGGELVDSDPVAAAERQAAAEKW